MLDAARANRSARLSVLLVAFEHVTRPCHDIATIDRDVDRAEGIARVITPGARPDTRATIVATNGDNGSSIDDNGTRRPRLATADARSTVATPSLDPRIALYRDANLTGVVRIGMAGRPFSGANARSAAPSVSRDVSVALYENGSASSAGASASSLMP